MWMIKAGFSPPSNKNVIQLAAFPAILLLLRGILHSTASGLEILFNVLAFILFPIWLIVILITLGRYLYLKEVERSILLLIIIALTYPFFYMSSSIGNYIHLAVMYPFYYKQIEASPSPKHLSFDWGTGGIVTGEYNLTLHYDETDNLQNAGSNYGTEDTEHLIGHFYLNETH